MAIVTFTAFWISPLTDLAAGIGFRLAVLESDPQVIAEARRYGNGRIRLATMPGTVANTPVTLRCDNRAQVEFLEANLGQVMLFRDPKGRKFYGTYLDPKITERPGMDAATVTITPQQITVDEAV